MRGRDVSDSETAAIEEFEERVRATVDEGEYKQLVADTVRALTELVERRMRAAAGRVNSATGSDGRYTRAVGVLKRWGISIEVPK